MAKEELKLQLMKWHNKMSAKFGFNIEDASEFSELMRQLDEPKKVVIPQFVDDWIEEYSKDFAPLGIVHQIANRSLEKGVQNHWRNDEGNQKLLLNAIANGYEVEEVEDD